MTSGMTLRFTVSIVAIGLLLAISIGCTFDGSGSPITSRAWAGCYRGGSPETGVLLEPVIDETGGETAMLTGCLRIGIGEPNPQMATLAGVVDNANTLEMSDGSETFLFSKDWGTPEDGDETITITNREPVVGPIPLCSPEQIRTCAEILGETP